MNDPQVLVLAVAAIALSAAWLLLLRWRSPALHWRQMLYPAVPIAWVVLMSQRQVFDPGLRDALERATLMGVTIWALLTAVWALGTVMRNHSIMDIAYPLTPWAATSLAWVQWGSNSSPHLLVLLALMSVWAWRLAGYLAVRYLPHGEEARYARWRERGGPHWLWWSYFQIHLTQGVLIWMWSWPLALALGTTEAHPVWTWAAIAAWTVGFVFEAGGDWQMHRFRHNPACKGQVMDRGLWAWCRHPNYFGEAMTWLSFGLFALASPWGWLGLPMVVMVFRFMNRGSALSMTERYLLKTKPGYAQYMERTPAFFPRPPQGGAR